MSKRAGKTGLQARGNDYSDRLTVLQFQLTNNILLLFTKRFVKLPQSI